MATAAVRQGNAGEAGEPLAFCETTKPEKATQASETAQPQERSMWFTAAKLKRFALLLLEGFLAVAIGIFVTGWLAGTSLFALPATLLLSGLAFFDICMIESLRGKIYDFQDPAEVRALQKEARLMSFEQLIKRYDKISLAQLLDFSEIREKCQQYIITHFDDIQRNSPWRANEFFETGLISLEQRDLIFLGELPALKETIQA